MSHFEEFQKDCLSVSALEAMIFSTEKSQKNKITDYEAIEHAIRGFIEMLEKEVELTRAFMSKVDSTPNDHDKQEVIRNEYLDKANMLIHKRSDSVDTKKLVRAYRRLSYKYRDAADRRKPNVKEAEDKLYNLCAHNGEIRKKLDALRTLIINLSQDTKKKFKELEEKHEDFRIQSYVAIAKVVNFCIDEYNYTLNDAKSTYAILDKVSK